MNLNPLDTLYVNLVYFVNISMTSLVQGSRGGGVRRKWVVGSRKMR